MMQTSGYNYYVPYKDGCIIMNGISEASFTVKKENAEHYRTIIEQPESFTEDESFRPFIDKMLRDGFIVDDSTDERELIRRKFRWKQRPDEYMVMLLPTYQCNLRCWYCIQDHADLWMTDEIVEKVKCRLSKMVSRDDIRRLSLSWFGGEPLLAYDRVLEISRWAKKLALDHGKDFGASITTNGTLLTSERIEALRDAGVRFYQISIDGNRETHDKIKVLGKRSAFETTLRNIGQIIQHTRCTLRFNYTKENMMPESLIADLDRILPEDGRSMIEFMIYKVWQEDGAAVDFAEVEKLAEMAMGIGLSPRLSDVGMCYADNANFDCIFTNGSVDKCDNTSPEARIGEIDEKGEIKWNKSTDSHVTILEHTASECHACRYLPICWGPCVSKRGKMIREANAVCCQFEDREEFIAGMVRNMHLNKHYRQLMAQAR